MGSAHARGAESCVPCVRLFADAVTVSRTEGLRHVTEEVTVPLIALAFDYAGTRVAASDARSLFFRARAGHEGLVAVGRDVAGEAEARHFLERLGAVELTCVDAIATFADADYVVRLDGDAHAFCDFTARALPRLRAQGFRVDVDPAYPFHVTPGDTPWFAAVEPDGELPGWFNLELGVEVDGARVDLLPLVMDLLQDADESEGLRALERRSPASYALRLNDTQHVTVSAERLRALIRVVIELYQGGGGGGRPRDGTPLFPALRAGALASLDETFRGQGTPIVWRGAKEVLDRGKRLRARARAAPPPAALRATLRPYQEEGLAFLQHLSACGVGGVLADDMGLGKTLQTIAHVCAEKASGRMDAPALVVAPTSLMGNWARELSRFAPHLRVLLLHGGGRHARWSAVAASDVVVTTYPLLLRDEERFAAARFHLLVLDEAQAIKNTRSQAHRAVKAIDAEHRVCLTGTPVENHLGELWAIFDFLNPGLLGDELCFRRAYRQPIERARAEEVDTERLTALREQVAPYILRRMKRDVARDLPPKTDLAHPVELRGEQRDLYEHIRVAAHADVRKVVRAKGLAASTLPILDALMKLRQVCCDPRLVKMDAARKVRESAKYEALLALVERELAAGHRILVFSQFTSMLALIAEGLRERGTPYLALTGATRERQRVVDAFEQGRADVFLISLKAGGTGLNLTRADTVIHYDPWWNPAAQAQATDRAYRIGQERPVFVHNFFVAGSVEERVLRLQQRKRWLSSTLLGDEGAPAAAITETDVDALFAPLEEEAALP